MNVNGTKMFATEFFAKFFKIHILKVRATKSIHMGDKMYIFPVSNTQIKK